MTKAVLVTGGAGYVGSHACKALAKAGYVPIAYDNLSLGNMWAVQWGPFVHGSLEERSKLVAAIRQHGVSAVMHFAAVSDVGESMGNPSKYFSNNVAQSLNVFDAMVETGIKNLVISSSSSVYGVPAEVPIGESAPVAPINTYGASKAMLEEVARWYGHAHGLRPLALRYFNAAGADPEGDIGECHRPETHLIPITIEAAFGLRRSIRVNGIDYPTPDGTAIRDYVHVSDLASAHVAGLRYLENGGPPRALNLGTGRGVSIREVVRAVSTAAESAPIVEHGPRRPGDPPVLIGDPSEALATLDWRIRHSDISVIAGTAVRWHRDFLPTKTSFEECGSLIRCTG